MPDTRKVSASIPMDEHVALKQLATAHGTTIESLLEYGIKLVFRKLKTDKRAAKTLPRDHRLRQ